MRNYAILEAESLTQEQKESFCSVRGQCYKYFLDGKILYKWSGETPELLSGETVLSYYDVKELLNI